MESSHVSLPPPPACITRDDDAAVDPARRRISSKSRFPRFLSLPNLKGSNPASTKKPKGQVNAIAQSTDAQGPAKLITLNSANLDTSDEYTDKYEWAIVYENQRGMTLFSIPYYSRLSLLPSDPPAFTIPNASQKREQRSITLAGYPLPDGTWRWVSKCWMIDMRSDSGEVQHDGFEYNWMFRTHKWSADVGALSAGGWVRRRRWIRLMMRPAKRRPDGLSDQSTSSISTVTGLTGGRRQSVGSVSPDSELLDNLMSIDEAWIKDDVEGNWSKCRLLMKRLGRDGRKLELWTTWLSQYHLEHRHAYEEMSGTGKARQKQWTEDDMPMPSEMADVNRSTCFLEQLRVPPKEDLILVLRVHGSELLQSFVYPDSRAKFLTMLGSAGLLPELNIGLGISSGASEMDFWSYTNILADKFPGRETRQL